MEKIKNRTLKPLKSGFIAAMMIFGTGCFYDESGEMQHILSKVGGFGVEKMAVPDQQFQAVLAQTVFRANRSALNVINDDQNNSEFKLNRVSLGLELEGEAGIKNVAEVAGEFTFELRFQRLPQ